ncbi:MAG TPA: bifunctional phosphopantothenoylcysteine decarboxylase/phosphopantothenate--cysteine ligase CoaBC [Candidatus Polarisedimenticolia bacterium]
MEVVLGVTGGIAAYKAAEIVRGLKSSGAAVTVVMTAHAREFITPLTLQTLSGRCVITSHFDTARTAAAPEDVEHIGLARSCDLLLVAPATAGTLGKMAAGIADDFLSTFYLAVTCPVAVAPAMNTIMWEHPAVQENIARLKARGVTVIGPETGPMASAGEADGIGRLADPASIVARALKIARGAGGRPRRGADHGALAGRRVLVTAGPTREDLDPVRTLTNPSTGKMGYAVAAAARDLGAEVTLVSGPTHLPDPEGVTTLRVTTAKQMRDAVMKAIRAPRDGNGPDIVVAAAAVSDFRPAFRSRRKIKKDSAALDLRLEATPDILGEVSRLDGKRFLVGFAAETEDLLGNASRKLKDKKLDLIVANSVAARGSAQGAFGSETNEVIVLGRRGRPHRWPRMTKAEVASRLMSLVARALK